MTWQRSLGVLLAILTLMTTVTSNAREDGLPEALALSLARSGIPQDALSLVVQPVGRHEPLLDWRGAHAMNPASTMKLVTTLAGLELLGPGYTWRTEVYVDGAQTDDVVEGNLVLKGYGDPRLTLDSFGLMLRELRARGIRDIRGDLVLDRSYFLLTPQDPGHFDGEPTRPYNVIPDALLLNFKSARFQFLPRPEQTRVEVFSVPAMPDVQVVNGLTLAPGPCEGMPERPETASSSMLVFHGTYSLECGERARSFALLDPDRYALSLFRQLWAELGGRLGGTVRPGETPRDARLVLTWQSPPMSDIVRDINKFSNNVMARQLFLTLSAEENPPGTVEKSAGRVLGWLHEAGIDTSGIVLENGAGLSRSERISARALAQILLRGFRAPWMPEYLASMPIAGVDGTARRRLEGSEASGRAHIKTGYLEGVRAIAGYVLDKHGHWLVVVSLMNHASAVDGQAFMDAVIEWVYQGERMRCCPRSRRARAATGCSRQCAVP